MPRKAYLVTLTYIRATLSKERGAVVHHSAVKAITIRRGFPKPYYTRRQTRKLKIRHLGRMWEKHLVDAYLAHSVDVASLRLQKDPPSEPHLRANAAQRAAGTGIHAWPGGPGLRQAEKAVEEPPDDEG